MVRVNIMWFAWIVYGSCKYYMVRVNIIWFAWILYGSREYYMVRVNIMWFAWGFTSRMHGVYSLTNYSVCQIKIEKRIFNKYNCNPLIILALPSSWVNRVRTATIRNPRRHDIVPDSVINKRYPLEPQYSVDLPPCQTPLGF